VLEPLRGYLILAERLCSEADAAEGWNFGPAAEDSLPVAAVVERLRALWPGEIDVQIDLGQHPKESAELRLDCSKAATELGWRPAISLQQALEFTTEWHRGVARDPAAARRLTLSQIEAYEALVSAASERGDAASAVAARAAR
jgi:CDP-glucose 4,6-dehydratase